jgi:hypothetical protein
LPFEQLAGSSAIERAANANITNTPGETIIASAAD